MISGEKKPTFFVCYQEEEKPDFIEKFIKEIAHKWRFFYYYYSLPIDIEFNGHMITNT